MEIRSSRNLTTVSSAKSSRSTRKKRKEKKKAYVFSKKLIKHVMSTVSEEPFVSYCRIGIGIGIKIINTTVNIGFDRFSLHVWSRSGMDFILIKS